MRSRTLPLIFIIAFVFLISLVSATVSCATKGLSISYPKNAIPTDEITIASQCSNSDNETVTGIKAGSFFTLVDNPLIIGGGSTKGFIKIKLEPNLIPKSYSGSVVLDNEIIDINIDVKDILTEQTKGGEIIVFPTSKVITVKLGQNKNQNIQLIIPSEYPESATVQSVSFNPDIDVVGFGDLDLGKISPGQTLNIPLIITTQDVQTGSYKTKLNILLTNSSGKIPLPEVDLEINVQATTNPSTSSTFTSPPSCSLSAVILSLNQTYSLSCSNVNSGVDINPIYNEFLEGTSVDLSNNVFVYKYKPIKYGNTRFEATFTYKNAPLFSKFSQEIKIQSTGASIQGTDLKFLLTPSLENIKNGEIVILQLVDNKTGSLVEGPQLYINAIPLEMNGSVFKYRFEAQRNYSLRGKASGYNDIIETVSLSSIPIELIISPISGTAEENFNITTIPDAISLLIDGNRVDNPYFNTLSAGNHEILAVREGYIDARQNISVEAGVTLSPSGGEFKKNINQLFTLNKNVSWEVFYQEDINTAQTMTASGHGTKVEFIPTKKGIYSIVAGGKQRGTYTLEGFNWNAKWWLWSWYYWVFFGILLISIYTIYRKRKGGSSGDIEAGFRGTASY